MWKIQNNLAWETNGFLPCNAECVKIEIKFGFIRKSILYPCQIQ